MPIWMWLIIGFILISLIGAILSFAKIGIIIALIIILLPAIKAYNLTDAQNYLDKIPTERVQVMETDEIEVFKINTVFSSGRSGLNLKIEDLKTGPEKIEIMYNPQRISEIPADVRTFIERANN